MSDPADPDGGDRPDAEPDDDVNPGGNPVPPDSPAEGVLHDDPDPPEPSEPG